MCQPAATLRSTSPIINAAAAHGDADGSGDIAINEIIAGHGPVIREVAPSLPASGERSQLGKLGATSRNFVFPGRVSKATAGWHVFMGRMRRPFRRRLEGCALAAGRPSWQAFSHFSPFD